MKKFYLIVGEASGDLHAANLVKEIQSKIPAAVFRGFGGDLMIAEGVEVIQHYRQIAYMGFFEVLKHLGKISSAIKKCKKDILAWQPDALILVDYPGFNLHMAKFARKKGIKVIYYILPQVWAWKESRAEVIRDNTDLLLSIIPFEKEFYKKYHSEVTFTGHPLIDVISRFRPDPDFRKKNNLDNKPVVAILPGSRRQEIRKILPVMLKAVSHFPDHQFIIGATSTIPLKVYGEYVSSGQVKIIYDATYDILSIAGAGMIKSGTSTLETALLNLPFFVCYKTSGINYFLGKQFIRNIKFISLVNLIPGRQIVKEFIQHELNEDNVASELSRVLTDNDYRLRMQENFKDFRSRLGDGGAYEHAAREIIKTFLPEEV